MCVCCIRCARVKSEDRYWAVAITFTPIHSAKKTTPKRALSDHKFLNPVHSTWAYARGGRWVRTTPPSPKRGHLHHCVLVFKLRLSTIAVPVMTAKCSLITLPHVTRARKKKQEKEKKGKKRRQCVKTLQGMPRKQSRWGWLEMIV